MRISIAQISGVTPLDSTIPDLNTSTHHHVFLYVRKINTLYYHKRERLRISLHG